MPRPILIDPSDLQEVVAILERACRDDVHRGLDDALDRLRKILWRDARENELEPADRSNFGMVYVDMHVYDDETTVEDLGRRAPMQPY